MLIKLAPSQACEERMCSRLLSGLADGHLHVHRVFALCEYLVYKGISHIGSGARPTPVRPHLTSLHPQQPYFQIKSHSEVLGVRTSACEFGGSNSSDHNREQELGGQSILS